MASEPVTPQIPDSTPVKPVRRRRPKRELIRTGTVVVIAVLIILFAVFNRDSVKVHWIFGSGRAPLIIVIAISFVVGVLLTHVVDRFTLKRR